MAADTQINKHLTDVLEESSLPTNSQCIYISEHTRGFGEVPFYQFGCERYGIMHCLKADHLEVFLPEQARCFLLTVEQGQSL